VRVRNVSSEYETCDVLVVGGGCAGTVAAIAAARHGQRTMLIEQLPFLGGTSTAVLDSFYGFYAPGMSDRLVSGIAWEVVQLLEARGAVYTRADEHGGGVGIGYDPEVLKELWDSMVQEAGVAPRLRSVVTRVEQPIPNDQYVVHYYINGTVNIVRATFIVDATGDANALALLGADFLPPPAIGARQSMTTTFKLAGVDVDAARSFDLSQFAEMLAQGRDAGLDLPHEDVHVHRMTYQRAALALMTRIEQPDLSDPAALAEVEMKGRRQAREYSEFLRRFVPGYADAHLVAFSTGIGIRESRRIVGRATLTDEDVRAGAHADDGVVLSGGPIEVQGAAGARWDPLPAGTVYGVPFGAQLPTGVPNAVVAGRCLSASPAAHASVRLMAQCMGLGESAAVGIDLAMASGTPLHQLTDASVGHELRKRGVITALPPTGHVHG
jgi:hypothetical protein